jgi:hypothetical protein
MSVIVICRCKRIYFFFLPVLISLFKRDHVFIRRIILLDARSYSVKLLHDNRTMIIVSIYRICTVETESLNLFTSGSLSRLKFLFLSYKLVNSCDNGLFSLIGGLNYNFKRSIFLK